MNADPKWCPGCGGYIGTATDDIDSCGTSHCEGVFTGIERGRFAGLRADVAYAAGQWEREAGEKLSLVAAVELRLARGEPAVPLHPNLERDAYDARDRAANCRRWLEATR